MTDQELMKEAVQAYHLLSSDPDRAAVISQDGLRLYTEINGVIVQASSEVNLNKLSDSEVGYQIAILRKRMASKN